ncbi:MAG TPA: hypothetical protein VN761_08635 [Candidatus Polarisedimenticolia bacterium]|nr:hypothetical protein [Candidatus Polarisedimenticolia bacterium]
MHLRGNVSRIIKQIPILRSAIICGVIACALAPLGVSAQINMDAGFYSQNFDTLSANVNNPWLENTIIPGWYASKSGAVATNYFGDTGTSTAGGLHSYGSAAVPTDRALGSIGSGPADPVTFGVRFFNNTTAAVTNITVSYTGEQWRQGNGSPNTLAFSYAVSSTPITNTFSAATWINFPALNFVAPAAGVATNALDGNALANQHAFTNIVLTGVTVPPGYELSLRWLDVNDTGNDDGIAIDDLTVTFSTNAAAPATAPSITTQPQDQTVTEGASAGFSVVASGTGPLFYQWSSNNVPVPGATNDTFTLFGVSTNLNGSTYFVTVTNSIGATNSLPAMLSVIPSGGALTYLTYNVDGNSVTGTDPTNWAVTAPQVQAIGRELDYLNPDIIAFNEIPTAYKWQMTNWVNAFLPGYYLASNAIGDGFIQNFIVSRWPIMRSQSWLSSSNLANFGYTNGNVTVARDLFEAQIAVPNYSQPLHVFVAHLKATTGGGQDDADRRAAEASCVSNFFVNVFLTGTNKLHPYILSGDLNEDILRPDTNEYVTGHPIQRLMSAPTGLQFTSPTNPFTGAPTNDMTESIRASKLTVRFDYIMPNPLMFSNIVTSQIFRTDKLSPVPPGLLSGDDKTASDHLPVLMVFKNPFENPFQLLSVTRSNPAVTLNWQSVPGQQYRVESSSDLMSWTVLATNLMATNFSFTFTTNTTPSAQFFRVRKTP